MTHTPLISLRNVSVSYGDREALHDVSLDVFDDDFLGIIGPNGGGKTTLVNAMLGAVPHTGTVTLSDELTVNGTRRIGYMPQISVFDRSYPISVSDVVLSGLMAEKGVLGRFSRSDRQRAEELLEMANLRAEASRQIGEVSGGQLQRALLCRAIIMKPKLLILDEPTNFVDNAFENELYRLLEHLSHEMAVVMVSHDIGTITSIVHSIVCVNCCVHRHDSNTITQEQLDNYNCPIQILAHGDVPHTILSHHEGCTHCHN